MVLKPISAAVAASFLLAAASPGIAGGKPVECYEPYRTAPVYGTVSEHVQVNPESSWVYRTPPIYGTRKREIQIRPEQVAYEVVPAVVKTKYRKVKVADGGYGWEWRWINGRKVLCKVKVKARYEKVAETVVVRAEYKRRIVIPAVYDYEVERVLIQPEQKRLVVSPPSYRTVSREVVIREGESGWKRVKIKNHCG
jgi:hypothetical protein